VADELAKLGSSRGIVPLGVFMQELHEPSINKTLSKASKDVESIDNATTPADDKSDSSDVMMAHSDCRTSFMIYLKIWGLARKQERKGKAKAVGSTLYSGRR
jgi:hypothetical protein